MCDSISSLSSPQDGGNPGFSGDPRRLDLEKEALEQAAQELIDESALKYIKTEKRYQDPLVEGQIFSLHSFIPSKGATADKDGVYGMVKFRGGYRTLGEATVKSEDLVRSHDSYHKIFIGLMGHPLPLTENSEWSKEVNEIDIQKKVSSTIAEDVKAKRAVEKLKVDEIREREKTLKESVEQEASDPYEKYTCLRVKKAQIIWGYLEHRKKMVEMKEVFSKTLEELDEMDEEDPDYDEKYLTRYKDARDQAGIPEDKEDRSFMRYLDSNVRDLEVFARDIEEEEKELSEDSDYKVSRIAGSTISVRHVAHPLPEGAVDNTKAPEKTEEEILAEVVASAESAKDNEVDISEQVD